MPIQKNFTPIPEGTLVLGADKYFCMDGKVTHVNNNVLVVGRSGSGKTRYLVKPNLLQCNGSYVVSDPKGTLRKEFGKYFEAKGYQVLSLDFVHPERSMQYNPFSKIHNTNDIKKIAHAITYAGLKEGNSSHVDPYWDQMTEFLFMGIIGYIHETKSIPKAEKNMSKFEELVYLCNRGKSSNASDAYDDMFGLSRINDKNMSIMAHLMREHNEQMIAKTERESWAFEQFAKVDSAPDKTYQTIISSTYAKIAAYSSREMAKLLSKDSFDFLMIGQRPTVLFVEVSDTDRSADMVVNLFYTQLMDGLCRFADKCGSGALPVPVQFILDDFATNCRIDNFENMISNIRSRGISAMLMVQSESQLFASYGESAQTIIDNCASYLYLGGLNIHSAEIAAKRANKPVHEILNMPIDTCWLFRIGEKPAKVDFVDIDAFQAQKGFVPCKAPVEPTRTMDNSHESLGRVG